MDPSRWNQVNELFFESLQVGPAERDQFLAQACRDDDELRSEVVKLLATDSSEGASQFLEPRVAEVSTPDLPDEHIGTRVGMYEIQELVGKGGMGNVYLATRVSDYEQRVAIKLLKAGMDSKEILHRFRNEIQFLAALGKHPNIAALLDAGLTEKGLPYLVMEYVEGTRIDNYCDGKQLDTKQRLRLFQTVCEGVQFAHQHAIIHRDLKPSNILVTSDGVPKLIDFGISKLTDTNAEEQITRTEMRLLTPQYASPEHVRGESVSTSSDVYSLGVVLYELLTGRRPYQWESHSLDVIQRTVCDTDPLRPSSAVSQLETKASFDSEDTTQQQRSAARRLQPRQLGRLLAGDIDNIVLMALRKEPERRYASAEQLSADIGRYLDGLPVLSRPDTWIYRCGKFIRRNRIGVAAAGLVSLSLLAGIVGTTSQWIRADRHAKQAVEEALQAKAARLEAEENRRKALGAVESMLTRVGTFDVPGFGEVRRELLKDALEVYRDFLAKNSDNEELRAETAHAYGRVGFINRLLGHHQDSREALEQAAAIFEELSSAGEERRKFHRAGLSASYHVLGVLSALTDKRLEAEEHFRKAIAIREEIAAEPDSTAEQRDMLASSLNDLGNLLSHNPATMEDAITTLKRALSLRLETSKSGHHQALENLISSYVNLANIYKSRGQLKEAEKLFISGIEVHGKNAENLPGTRNLATYVSSAAYSLAATEQLLKRFDKAKIHYTYAITVQTKLVNDFPAIPQNRYLLAVSHYGLAGLLAARHEYESARQSYETAINLLRDLSKQFDDTSRYKQVLARNYTGLVTVLRQSQPQQAEQALAEAHAIYLKLAADMPGNADIQEQLAASHSNLAGWRRQTAQPQEAVAEHNLAIAILTKAKKKWGSKFDTPLANAFLSRGVVQSESGKGKAAGESFRESLKLLTPIVSDDPEHRNRIALVHYALGNLQRQDKATWKQAEASYREARKRYESLAKDFPKAPYYQHVHAQVINNLGTLLNDQKREPETLVLYQEAARRFAALVGKYPQVANYRFDLGGAYRNLGNACRADQPKESEKQYLQAVNEFQTLCHSYPKKGIYILRLVNTLADLESLLKETDPVRAKEFGQQARQWRKRVRVVPNPTL